MHGGEGGGGSEGHEENFRSDDCPGMFLYHKLLNYTLHDQFVNKAAKK